MSFFENEDFEKIIDGYGDSVPDGYVDASRSFKVFEEFTEALSVLNVDDEQSRMIFMMRIINMVNQEDELSSFEVLSASTYHIINLLSICVGFKEDFMQTYTEMMYEHALPELKKDGGDIPYWD